MDLYSFVVESFKITDTRALHTDTLTLSHTVIVDGDLVAHRALVKMDDFDNGEYSPSDYAPDSGGIEGVVINDPMAQSVFVFQLINAGNPDGALTGRLAATADQIAGIVGGAAALGTDATPIGLGIEAIANLFAWLTNNCDGPVAIDQIAVPRYMIDTWTEDLSTTETQATRKLTMNRHYPGSDSPTGCGGNSNYEVTWSVGHWRTWVPVTNTADNQQVVEFPQPVGGAPLKSDTAVSATMHNGAVHAFGVLDGGAVTHARTFSGAFWAVDTPDLHVTDLAKLPVSAVSFDDRLYVFGVHTDGSVSSLAYSRDGRYWVPRVTVPPTLKTAEPIATAVFRDRLFLFAQDSTTNSLRFTSSADLIVWNPWVDVPPPGLPPLSAVTAATLGNTLHIFRVFDSLKKENIVMHNSTTDGTTWSGWGLVESGIRPEELPGTDPIDVVATIFRDRVYLASRWRKPANETEPVTIAMNFSGDGVNWSGWRIPESTAKPLVDYTSSPEPSFQLVPNAPAGLAEVNNHLYILAPGNAVGDTNNVWAY
ncbi:MAG TPA: hypothetical protein VFA99_12375 [Acidobacteriaceae bacterium]|nr:hypothetical protein [Acidobacteriaceae bacterium]